MFGQPSRGRTRRRRNSPKFAIARATVPIFCPSCGSTRTTIGPAMSVHGLVLSVPEPGMWFLVFRSYSRTCANCSRRQIRYETPARPADRAARGRRLSDQTAKDRRRLVLGAAVGFRVAQVRVFVESLRATGYAGDVTMLVGAFQWRLRAYLV